ncbi:MAG: hypothetical protein DDT26_02053 [Dehalococcoidia bacterium]|nr:hypothetical protein [Chloroflexota bacterium]
MTSETMEKVRQIFRLAYHDGLLLHFRSNTVNTATAMELVDIIGEYNGFDPDLVKEAMQCFQGQVSGYAIGREYSPAIYVWLPYWTHQRENSLLAFGEYIQEGDRERLKKEIMEAFVKLRPDEADEWAENVLRFWWD